MIKNLSLTKPSQICVQKRRNKYLSFFLFRHERQVSQVRQVRQVRQERQVRRVRLLRPVRKVRYVRKERQVRRVRQVRHCIDRQFKPFKSHSNMCTEMTKQIFIFLCLQTFWKGKNTQG